MDVRSESSNRAGRAAEEIQHPSLIYMRTLIELLIVAALIGLTWQQSLQERVASLTGAKLNATATPGGTPAPIVRYVSRPAPAATASSGEWMWDPAHRSALDRPAYDTHFAQQHYVDPQGRGYWYDSKGVRHYDQ
jgi:hypothetical protein